MEACNAIDNREISEIARQIMAMIASFGVGPNHKTVKVAASKSRVIVRRTVRSRSKTIKKEPMASRRAPRTKSTRRKASSATRSRSPMTQRSDQELEDMISRPHKPASRPRPTKELSKERKLIAIKSQRVMAKKSRSAPKRAGRRAPGAKKAAPHKKMVQRSSVKRPMKRTRKAAPHCG